MLLRLLVFLSSIVSLITIALNAFVYGYPHLDAGHCSWAPSQSAHSIRLLAVGDPQIDGIWPHTPPRKRLDIYGNDHYLGHIYSVMKRHLQPPIVAVLGDLVSNNYVSDSEYFNRTRRYATRLFPRPEAAKLSESDTILSREGIQSEEDFLASLGTFPIYYDLANWDNSPHEPLFINTTGNHDIGYSGETSYNNLYRYTKYFGRDNFQIRYAAASHHPWRIVVLNSLLLDGPALHPELLDNTWGFVHSLANDSYNGSTILITHVPLYKPHGVCVDGPQTDRFANGDLRRQNLLSPETSQKVLDAVFGNGKPGVVLTGHDHEGCLSYYAKKEQWDVFSAPPTLPYVREITVRSIMGDYDGNVGILTGSFDKDWSFEYSLCPFAIQHVWWASKVSLIVFVSAWSIVWLVSVLS